MAANKRAVVEFYERAINQKDFEAAADLGPRHVRHNPSAADGGKISKLFSPSRVTRRPNYHSEINRIFADGDCVIQHVHNTREPDAQGTAVVRYLQARKWQDR
jgi:predicted SnoaL-like aldol condensation-catalyzing enzyme